MRFQKQKKKNKKTKKEREKGGEMARSKGVSNYGPYDIRIWQTNATFLHFIGLTKKRTRKILSI